MGYQKPAPNPLDYDVRYNPNGQGSWSIGGQSYGTGDLYDLSDDDFDWSGWTLNGPGDGKTKGNIFGQGGGEWTDEAIESRNQYANDQLWGMYADKLNAMNEWGGDDGMSVNMMPNALGIYTGDEWNSLGMAGFSPFSGHWGDQKGEKYWNDLGFFRDEPPVALANQTTGTDISNLFDDSTAADSTENQNSTDTGVNNANSNDAMLDTVRALAMASMYNGGGNSSSSNSLDYGQLFELMNLMFSRFNANWTGGEQNYGIPGDSFGGSRWLMGSNGGYYDSPSAFGF